jgi:hypothetical protein
MVAWRSHSAAEGGLAAGAGEGWPWSLTSRGARKKARGEHVMRKREGDK